MQTVIIVIHLLVVIALVGVVLIQRSEGGGLGIGGGSGFMTARGTKNTLTRLTAILAVCFFLTSIILTVMQLVPNKDGSNILRQVSAQEQKSDSNNLLDSLGGPKTDSGKTDAAGTNASGETLPADDRASVPAQPQEIPAEGAAQQ